MNGDISHERDTKAFARYVLLWAIFLSGIAIATLVWPLIVTPFENPWEVVGPLTRIGFNPLNNQIRALIFVGAPAICLILARFFGAYHSSRSFAIPDAGRPSRNTPLAALIIFSAVLIATSLPTLNAWGPFDGFHEGEALGSAESYFAGKTPYRDYLFIHGLYQDPLRAAWSFDLFGRSIGAARTLESIVKCLDYGLLGLLLVILFETRLELACAALLFLFSINGFGGWLPPAALAPRDLPTLLFLLSSLLFHRSIEKGAAPGNRFVQWSCLACTGALIPFALGYSVDRGAYILGAGCLSLVGMLFLMQGLRDRLAGAAIFAVSLAAAALPLLRILEWNPGQFIHFNFFVLPRYKDLLDGYVLEILDWQNFAVLTLAASSLYLLTLAFLETPACPTERKGKLRPFLSRFYFELSLCIVAILILRNVTNRPDRIHIEYSSLFLYLCCLALLARRVGARWSSAALLKPALAVLLLLDAACAARLFMGNLFAANFPLRISDDKFLGKAYHHLADFLQAEKSHGRGFFVFTSDPSIYYLARQTAPVRFSLAWAASPRFYQEEMIRDLERTGVPNIIMNSLSERSEPDGISIEERLPLVARYVREHYKEVRRIDNFIVLQRTPGSPVYIED